MASLVAAPRSLWLQGWGDQKFFRMQRCFFVEQPTESRVRSPHGTYICMTYGQLFRVWLFVSACDFSMYVNAPKKNKNCSHTVKRCSKNLEAKHISLPNRYLLRGRHHRQSFKQVVRAKIAVNSLSNYLSQISVGQALGSNKTRPHPGVRVRLRKRRALNLISR